MKCCDITAGMLNTQISFERSTRSSDGAGGYTDSWAAVSGAPDRAMIKSVSGSQQWDSERTEGRSALRIVCRYSSSVAETDRIVIRNKAYDIIAMNNLEFQDRWFEIDVAGGVPT